MFLDKIMIRIIVTIVFLFTVNQVSEAQEDIFSLGLQLGTGTRALAMGGAYTAIGGDYSASFWNPATLRDIRRVEVFGTLSHLVRENNSEFSGFGREDKSTFTKLKDFGIAYPVPTSRGSLVFSFGYNRVKSYDSTFDFRWFNSTADDSVNQAWNILNKGSLNSWILAGAVDVSEKTSVGFGLNFWTGNNDFLFTFRDVDIENYWDSDVITREDMIDSEISGFNVKLGALHRIGRFMRIGATISTPITFKVEEDWSTELDSTYDDGSYNNLFDEGIFDYKIKSPFTFTGGASINLLNFVVSGEVEYNDWSQIEYKSEPPVIDYTKAEANRLIRDNYRATTKIRLGAEFTLPLTGLSFRAGYMRDPSVFQNESPDLNRDRQFYTAGLGFLLDKQVKLDLAFVHGFWNEFDRDLSETTDDLDALVEDIKINKFLVSLAFRL